MSGRNLILCFDGTNNEFGREDTNVVRLVRVLDRTPTTQRLYYDPGVGTLPEPGIFVPAFKTLSEWVGLAFGLGLTRKVREAYGYLMDYWEPGDRVFIFGFSRGAYTARVLAGLLYAVGLLPRGGYNLIPYALKYFRQIAEGRQRDSGKIDTSKWKDLCNDFRRTFSRQITSENDDRRFPVHFLGIWDTVSSVGWAWEPKHFPYTAYNPGVAHIRHAVAIDEHRAFFRQNLLHPATGQDVIERWFPGVHCDVGGGYSTNQGRLWWAPFHWILNEATGAGLALNAARQKELFSNVPTRPWAEQINNSFKPWIWNAVELVPKMRYSSRFKRRFPHSNLWRRRQIPSGAVIDAAAIERLRDNSLGYVPSNLSTSFCQSVQTLTAVPPYIAVP